MKMIENRFEHAVPLKKTKRGAIFSNCYLFVCFYRIPPMEIVPKRAEPYPISTVVFRPE